MHHIMAKFWWILAARGILGILLGLASVGWIVALSGIAQEGLGLTLFAKWATIVATLVLLLGLYAFLDGLFAVILGAQDYGDGRRWWTLIAEGLLSIGLGILTWLKPEWAVLALLYWIAGWAVLTGLLEIFQAADLNEYKERRSPLYFAGFCSLAFGGLILIFRAGGITLVSLMGAYAFAFGIPLLVLSLRLRRYAKARQDF
jgi:uncharacterized membrane protein HdeD (DUF308 family)